MSEFNRITPPEPSANEVVIWRGDAVTEFTPKTSSAFLVWVGRWAYKVIGLAYIGYFIYKVVKFEALRDSDPELWADIFFSSVGGALGGLLLFIVLMYFARLSLNRKYVPAASGIPLWMSKTRLAFTPSIPETESVLNIKDIKAISRDYCEGSPSIAIKTHARTLNLISSDLPNFLKHLYTLRLDLEPTL